MDLQSESNKNEHKKCVYVCFLWVFVKDDMGKIYHVENKESQRGEKKMHNFSMFHNSYSTQICTSVLFTDNFEIYMYVTVW